MMIPNTDPARMPFQSGQDTAHLRRFIPAQPSRSQKSRQVIDIPTEEHDTANVLKLGVAVVAL